MRSPTSLHRNILLNVLGSCVPLLVSIITVPLYLASIGSARYGILALVWLFVGYFGLLDFGLSRATTHQIARIPLENLFFRQQIFWSALWLNAGIGLIAMLCAYPAAFYVIDMIDFTDQQLRIEILASIPWLCLLIPLTLVSAVGTGALEANDRFDLVNSIQVFGAIATQVIPVLVARKVGVNLEILIFSIVCARVLTSFLLFLVLKKSFQLKTPLMWDLEILRTLVRYGGRVSLSTMIGSVIEALDRFVIGAKLGAADIAAYAIPLSVADKLRIIPRSLGRAAFPAISRSSETEARMLYERLLQLTLCVMTPLVLVAIYSAKMLLELWIGQSHARESEVVAVILLCGAWFNAIAVVPFVYLQSRGRPGITAKINLFEFLPFILALLVFVHYFGIIGAALAWTTRMMVDTIALLFFVPVKFGRVLQIIFASCIVCYSTYWMSFYPLSWPLAVASIGMVLALFFPAARSFIQLRNK